MTTSTMVTTTAMTPHVTPRRSSVSGPVIGTAPPGGHAIRVPGPGSGGQEQGLWALHRRRVVADTHWIEAENLDSVMAFRQRMPVCAGRAETMKRVVVDQFGGPDVVRVVEDDDPRPGNGEVCIKVLAAGVSLTDAQLRAGTYLGGPKPPFTPGYELVGVVEELGPGCSRLGVGDRVGALTVWGADAERVCVPEEYAVEVPEDLDPAEVVSVLFPYMSAYQMLHRTARVQSGETVLMHGAAGRVGTAVLELGALAGCRMIGTASARDLAAVERLGAVAIDYRNEDFVARVREVTDDGVDVVLDAIGGAVSLRSFGVLRRGDALIGDPGGRLVVFGRQNTLGPD